MRVRRVFGAEAPLTPAAVEALDRWLAQARITAGKAREWRGASPWEVGPRQMDSALWLWLGRGRGRGRVGELEYVLRPGDVVVARGRVVHWIWLEPAPDLHFVTAHFQVQVNGGLDLLQLVGFPGHLEAGPRARYRRTAQRLAREYALGAPGWQQAMGSELFGFLIDVVRRHGDRLRLPEAPGFARDLQRLLPALLLLERDLGRDGLSVAELAREAQVSEVYLRRLFRRVVGTSPVSFVQRQRVQRAAALLRASERPIKDIAAACGFGQVPHFHRVFRRWIGATPAQYRSGVGVD